MRHAFTIRRFLVSLGLAAAFAPGAAAHAAVPSRDATTVAPPQNIRETPLTASGDATSIGDAVTGAALYLNSAATTSDIASGLDAPQSFKTDFSGPIAANSTGRHSPPSARLDDSSLRTTIPGAFATMEGFLGNLCSRSVAPGHRVPGRAPHAAVGRDPGVLTGRGNPVPIRQWMASGTPAATGKLFASVPSTQTLSIDRGTRQLFTIVPTDVISRSLSDLALTEHFRISPPRTVSAAMTFDLSAVEYLFDHPNDPTQSIPAASNSLASDLLDRLEDVDFSREIAGSNPSLTGLLFSPVVDSLASDDHSIFSVHAAPVWKSVYFQTEFLPVVVVPFRMRGATAVVVDAVPKRTANLLLATAGLSGVIGSICRRRAGERKRQRRGLIVDTVKPCRGQGYPPLTIILGDRWQLKTSPLRPLRHESAAVQDVLHLAPGMILLHR